MRRRAGHPSEIMGMEQICGREEAESAEVPEI